MPGSESHAGVKRSAPNPSTQADNGRPLMKATMILVLLTFLCPNSALSQNPDDLVEERCPEVNPQNLDGIQARMSCLQEEITAAATIDVLAEINKELLEELARLRGELEGPKKDVIQIPAQQRVWTRGHWSHGQHWRDFECVDRKRKVWSGRDLPRDFGLPPNPNRRVYRRFGAGLSEWKGGGGCQDRGFCDSAGEHCSSKDRERGCFVNTDWYEWVVRRQMMPLNYVNVCAEPGKEY